MSNRWTPEQTETVHRMAQNGATAAEIAAVVGKSREAVRQKADYEGVALRTRPRREIEAPPPAPKRVVIPTVRYPSRMAMMFGDPPIGRSALDQKRAGA